jgi:hypothetical protein
MFDPFIVPVGTSFIGVPEPALDHFACNKAISLIP